MKKRWICFISSGAVFLLIAGMWLGTKISMEQINNQKLYSSNIKSTIAVINQDVGVHNGVETMNYSEALISTLNDDYKVVSYKEAQSGMEQGIYSAIVTFPSTLSSQVYSINESELQSPKVEFTVNASLTEEAYINTYLRMLDLQNDINESISYLYLVSVYDELHSAQDQVKKIFQNDDDDIKALNSIQLHDFRLDVDWSDMPEVQFEPKEINFDDFIATVQGYANNMSDTYIDSYAVAQSDYENFQNNFSTMANMISHESFLWFDDVNERENNVTAYAGEVSDYSDSVFHWSNGVQQWNADTAAWNTELSTYQDNLDMWKSSILDWKSNLIQWGDAYENELDLYKESVEEYQGALNEYSGQVYDFYRLSTQQWAENYTQYAQNTENWKDASELTVHLYNSQISNLPDYIHAARAYGDQINTYRETVSAYYEGLAENLEQNYYTTIKNYHKTLHDSYFGTEEESGLVDQITDYYHAVQDYEQVTLNYKNDLDQYVLSYITLLDQYYNDRYINGNVNAVQPDFDLDSVILGMDEDYPYDFEDIRSDLDSSLTALGETYETQENVITEVEMELNDLFSHDAIVSPPDPSYSDETLPDSDTFAAIDTSVFESYETYGLEDWNAVCDIEEPDSNMVQFDTTNSDSILPEDVTDFDQTLPVFFGGDFQPFAIERPQPLVDTVPAVPDQLAENCNAIVSESVKYIPSSYLNDETKSQVDDIVETYASHLNTVDSNLNNTMHTNNDSLLQAYHEYNSYISTLYGDATQAYTAQETDLIDTLNTFYDVKKATSDENKKLLGAFSVKLPNSRINAVTNKDFVNFTISPIQFVSGNIRAGAQTGNSFQELQLRIYSIVLMCLIGLIILSVCAVLLMHRIHLKKLSKLNNGITISSSS